MVNSNFKNTKLFNKSNAFRIGFIVLLMYVLPVYSQSTFDPIQIQKDNPKEDFVLLDYKVDIKFDYDKNEELIIKTRHRKEYFILSDNPYILSNIPLLFGSTQDVKVKMARYYDVDSLGKKSLFENVKVKFLKERNYYINGVFYNDLKSKNISTRIETGVWTYFIVDYEYIDSDLKFINSIYPNPYDEKVFNFTLTVETPSYIDFDIVPFNIDAKSIKITKSGLKRTYCMSDVLSVESGNFPPPYSYVAPHFVPVVRKIKGENYMESPADLFNWYNSLISELKGNDKFINDIVQQIIKNTNTTEDKIEAIYKFAQNNINYIAYEDGIAGFKPDECDKVLNNGYGDCKGYANVLTNMFQAAGIESGHAWIGTRNIPYKYNLAALCVDNHMVCWVKNNDKTYILDGTGQDFNWKTIPYHLQGKEILLKKGDDYEIIILPIRSSKENKIILDAVLNIDAINPFDVLEGNLKITGNESVKLISTFNEVSVISEKQFVIRVFQSYFGNNFSDFFVENIRMSLVDEILTFDFKVNTLGNKIKVGDELFLFSSFDEDYLSINYPKRAFYFDNLVIFESNVIFNYDVNYKVKTIPANVFIENDLFSLKSEITVKSNSLSWNKEIEVKKLFSDKVDIEARKEYQSSYQQIFENPLIIKIN